MSSCKIPPDEIERETGNGIPGEEVLRDGTRKRQRSAASAAEEPCDSASFFRNQACPYFPCHQTEEPSAFNCLFCYCPLYMLGEECGGNFRFTEGGIKDCSLCTIPHRPDAAKLVNSRFPEIARKAGMRRGSQPDRPGR